MKQSLRYRHDKKGDGLVERWPDDVPSPDILASQVMYVGSGEHKVHPIHPSYDIDPDLRSTNSACPIDLDRPTAEAALRRAVR